jgi:hypothetical protein
MMVGNGNCGSGSYTGLKNDHRRGWLLTHPQKPHEWLDQEVERWKAQLIDRISIHLELAKCL